MQDNIALLTVQHWKGFVVCAADDGSCSARAQEIQIMEIIEQKRCSRREARIAIAERSRGYSSATTRFTPGIDSSLSEVIASTIEKTMTKVMENLFITLTESLAQIVNAQMSQILNANHPAATSPLALSSKEISPGSRDSASLETSRKIIIAAEEDLNSPKAGPSNSSRKVIIPVEHDPDWSSDSGSQDSQMELESRNMKRRASPGAQSSPMSPKVKSKKHQKETASKRDFLKDSILEKAVNTAGILTQ